MKREVREQRLHDLVERFLAHLTLSEAPCATERSLELIAHSPESPIAQAVAGHLPRLKVARVEVRAIFAFTDPEPLMARWLSDADWVRWAKDVRLLEAHEQLVLGNARCWTGDAMRRGSTKTDLFESLNEGCNEAAALGRTSFRQLARFANIIRPRRVTASLNA
ncbi:MAG: hypothetical protein ABL907_00120, partial [Hyphomicrobium sp.]